ncbi:Transcription factor fungi [Macrophomina phaseolina MS6]|uniref:Transcription factor fungi n=1 Tax=Macrophomina phaseolina (strain MS6) TaxID=1126212 RepID=K2R480_MACPH|nr:Transcription factor fungi [Macrophomina phaseolina MS6]
MLQDPTGRLLYVGDAASLSFLQLLRMMVENVAGPSAFTTDPRRHKITEIPFSLPANMRHTNLLPDKRTAYILMESFFVNTHGFLQIFERHAFTAALERCYSDPLTTEPSWLCLLNLVFAIGLMLATPRPGTPDAAIIDKLHRDHPDRAEVFYMNAKNLNDPLHGFEDADFWSVQALLLMSYYMLVKSKRNTAFALLGMAVRSAYALGLHREETMVIFGQDEQAARRNMWRSLFVMDRFLSFSLGRPVAISEEDCSGDTLRPAQPEEQDAFGFDSAFQTTINQGRTNASALEAAVRSCSVIGRILKEVYQQRKISTRLAQEIADVCKLWPKALAPQLHWRQAPSACPSQGIAILHVNLFYCHSIILLTRPFFLFILNAETQKEMGHQESNSHARNKYSRMEKFSEACVIASSHSIVLVQAAFEAGYLPRRNPAVMYFLFASALVLLANEFAGLYMSREADMCINNAVNVMAYCAECDQQASRLFHILETFKDVVNQQRERPRRLQPSQVNPMGSLNQPTPTQQQYPGPTLRPPVPAESQQYPQPFQQTANFSGTAGPTSVHLGTNQELNQSAQSHLSSTALLSPTVTTPVGATTPHNPVGGVPSSGPAMAPSPVGSNFSGAPPTLSRNLSLSNLLDLNALDSVTGLPSLRSEDGSSAGEEHIDFDALWAWPSNTPAVGSPRIHGEAAVQGISDSAVPLFGVYDQ